jgi:cytochrome c553
VLRQLAAFGHAGERPDGAAMQAEMRALSPAEMRDVTAWMLALQAPR